MKPEQKAALAMAGYTMAQIEAMDVSSKPVTLEGLAATVTALEAKLAGTQAAAAAAAEQPSDPTAEDILKGIVEAKKEEK